MGKMPALQSKNIKFLCAPEDYDVIARPVPAKTVLPEWFRKLPPVDKDHLHALDSGQTIKRCMPFLDAMTTGWIIPLAASVRIEISDEGKNVNYGWDFHKTMTSNHSTYQIAGSPALPRPPCKFHNYWNIVTPKGWSCLFLPPINRKQPVFEVFSGVVDTDSYTALIHFPFVATGADGKYSIEKGTPMVQVIPFRRDVFELDATIRSETKPETEKRLRIARSVQAGQGWYRTQARAPR